MDRTKPKKMQRDKTLFQKMLNRVFTINFSHLCLLLEVARSSELSMMQMLHEDQGGMVHRQEIKVQLL